MSEMLSENALEQNKPKKNFLGMGLVNPVIRKMQKAGEVAADGEKVATYGGIAIKTGLFLLITMLGIVGYFELQGLFEKSGNIIEAASGILALRTTPMGLLCLLGVIVLTIAMPLLCWLWRGAIPVVGTIYCIAQGYFVGFIADALAPEFKWLAILSLVLTIALVAGMLFLYSKRIIRVTNKMRSVIITLFVASILGGILMFVMSLIPGLQPVALALAKLMDSPAVGIIVGIVFIIIGALMLLVDFDAIEKCVENRLPKKREWMAAFGLAYTIIYLYLRILELLMKIFGKGKK